MRISSLLIFIILLFLNSAQAEKECLLSKAMSNPRIMSNEQFWNEYSVAIAQGKDSDTVLKHMMAKYKDAPDTAVQIIAPSFKKSIAMSLEKRAKKDVDHLPVHLKEKFDEFLNEVTRPGGLKNLYSNPGRWHYEKLKATEHHTIRLNKGYRVLFDIKDDQIIIKQVNAAHIHDHL